jgi:Fe-S oxidoreductase
MEAAKIFDCEVQDVAKFALKLGARVEHGGDWLYHAPCHDSLEGRAPEVLAKLAGMKLERVPHCCSEAGTLALSRPDVSDAMLHRKRAALAEAVETRRDDARVVLTNCPSCLQGLGRNAALGVTARHIAVELARAASGRGWMEAFRERAARAVAIRF